MELSGNLSYVNDEATSPSRHQLRLVGVAPKRLDGLTGVGFIDLRFEWE